MAALLAARTIALVRRLAERAMQDTCSITDPGVPTSDGGGTITPSTPTTRTSPCLFFAPSGDETADAIVAVRGRYRLSLPWNTAISERSSIGYGGRSYAVVWVPLVGTTDAERIIGISEAR